MRHSGSTKSGIVYVVVSAVLWATFPVFSAVSFKVLPPLTVAALATLFATIFFFCIITVRREWSMPSRETTRNIAIACVLIGIIYYSFVYIGLSKTTPGNAAIVSLSEVFFSYLFISVLGKHEKFVLSHVSGAILMIAGVLCVLIPSFTTFHSGDLIILVGSMFPPIGNLAMKRARKDVSASFIMFWRSLAGTLVFVLLAYVLDPVPSYDAIVSSLPSIIFAGVALLGFSKILWIESIHRLPVTQGISIACAQPFITLLFAYLILDQAPEWVQLLSLPPIVIGMWLLTRSPRTVKEDEMLPV